MSMLPTNRKAEADRSSLQNDGTATYTSNVTTAPTHTLSGRDPDESLVLTDTLALGVAERSKVPVPAPNYVYYRFYAEDGAIPSKTATPSDPFLGRIKARSVPPPHTANTVKRCIAKAEDIKDPTSTSLFLTPYSQSPMSDADKVTIFNRTGPGSTPQEPLALVAKMSDSERSALDSESGGRGGLANLNAADTAPPKIRYLYYLLYANDNEMPSKVAVDPDEPSLGRIRADSVAPPHSPASIKRCISRVERTPAFTQADLFADISCDAPLKDGHISFLLNDGPGLSANVPLAVVQKPVVQVEIPIPEGKYVIKNRASDIFWNAGLPSIMFLPTTMVEAKNSIYSQWDITHDTNGNIFMKSLVAPFSWVGAEITGNSEITISTDPIPWGLLPADSKFYYLTTDRFSQNTRVPVARPVGYNVPGTMATLKDGDQWQIELLYSVAL